MEVSNARQGRWERAVAPVRIGQVSGMVSDAFVRGLKRLATHLPLHRQAALVSQVLPARHWLRAARIISDGQGRLVTRMGGNGRLTAALMLDHWLRELSFFGSYPLPLRITGLEGSLTPGPKLFCWTHLPLTEIPLRAYLQAGGPHLAVVSDPGKIVGRNQFQVFGWSELMQALPADGQLLSRVKTTLRSGTSVVFLADPYLGGPMSEVPVRLAAKLQVPLILQWAELTPSGTLEVTFREAPQPYSRTEAEIAENMAFLKAAKIRTLAALGWDLPA